MLKNIIEFIGVALLLALTVLFAVLCVITFVIVFGAIGISALMEWITKVFNLGNKT